MSGPQLPAVLPVAPRRTRRRRRLAAALRWAAGQERAPRLPAPGTAALAERLHAIAEEQGQPAAPEADLPERLARLQPGTPIPPEVLAAVAAILIPILQMPPAPRSTP